MTTKPTNMDELVAEWTSKSGGNLFSFRDKLDLLTLLRDSLFSQYQPFPEKPDYMDRLFSWVSQSSSTKDRKTLFELATWLLFIGQEEMQTLYRSSFTEVVTRWVIDTSNIDITSPIVNDEISQAISTTFFGSIAGMEIGQYCRQNGIQGQSFRPDFREHRFLGDPISLQNYLSKPGHKHLPYERIVAVEDYVGSGQQMSEATELLSKLTNYPVLLAPILIAPEGVQVGNALAAQYPHISFIPLFPLPSSNAVPLSPGNSESEFISRLRKFLKDNYPSKQEDNPTQPLYGPCGCGDVGSLVLTYLNCPDNVPPAVHHQSDSWEPLFKRASREA